MKRKLIKGVLAAVIFSSATSVFAFAPISLVTFRTGLNYIQGETTQNTTAERKLSAFSMNKFETTYSLWYEIRTKAEETLGYKFQHKGQAGANGKYGAEPTEENSSMPVTMISWYDAIVWCNALSELKGRTPCYTYSGRIIRNSNDTASCDLSTCDFESNGFRLPTEAEWEYAARRTKTGFQSDDQISGQSANTDPLLYAWTSENADDTRIVGTAGIPFDPNTISEPGSGNHNGAGLFDMSGNVMEFCWDWFEEYSEDLPYGPEFGFSRAYRGGSWSPYTTFLYSGDRYSFDANECYNYFGFRIACTAATPNPKPAQVQTVEAAQEVQPPAPAVTE